MYHYYVCNDKLIHFRPLKIKIFNKKQQTMKQYLFEQALTVLARARRFQRHNMLDEASTMAYIAINLQTCNVYVLFDALQILYETGRFSAVAQYMPVVFKLAKFPRNVQMKAKRMNMKALFFTGMKNFALRELGALLVCTDNRDLPQLIDDMYEMLQSQPQEQFRYIQPQPNKVKRF